jgi:hypothetical protein
MGIFWEKLKKQHVIGIIDSGINRKFILENSVKIKKAAAFDLNVESGLVEYFEYNERNIQRWLRGETNYISDEHGHGTSVLSIISKGLPKAEFVISKVLDHEKKGYSKCLIESIRWMVEKTDVQIINISIATGDNTIKDDLLKLVKKARKKGIFIYCAKEGGNNFPANIEGVVSVTDSLTLKKVAGKSAVFKSDIVIEKNEEKIWWAGEWIQDPISPSWACAVAVANLFRIDKGQI